MKIGMILKCRLHILQDCTMADQIFSDKSNQTSSDNQSNLQVGLSRSPVT